MKTLVIKILVSTLIVFFNINSLVAQDYDFRNTKWGNSSAAVKASEKSKLISEDQTNLVYNCSLANIKAKIVYIFTVDDKLIRSKYFLSPDYSNLNFYVRDYKMFQELLKEKYGESDSYSVKAIDKQSIREDEWPLYLSSGRLRVETVWSTDRTDILLTLSRIGDKPAIQIDYISKEVSKIDVKEKKELILKDL